MRKFSLLICALLFMNGFCIGQNVYFSLSNTAKFLKKNSTDTLKYPFVGGFQKPQFNKMDLNNDGIKDLVVFDPIGNKIFTYLWKNNDWNYAPEYESGFPAVSQWLKLIDSDKDGKEDIFTATGQLFKVEPDKLVKNSSIRYLQNTSNASKMSFIQNTNCLVYYANEYEDCLSYPSTDIGVIEDMTGDGKLDVLYVPSNFNTFNLYKNVAPTSDSLYFRETIFEWGHFNYKIVSHGFNFQQRTRYLGKGSKHVSNSFALFDLDADGDKDVIFGDGAFSNLIMAKNGKELSPLGRDSMISEDTIFPRNTFVPNDIIWPTPYFDDFDNDGVTDLIVSTNASSGVKNANNVYFYKNLAASNSVAPNFSFVKENFLQDEMLDLGGNSKPVFTDIDNDGDSDLIVATRGNFLSTKDSSDQLYFYKNIGSATNPVFSLVDTNFANIQAGLNAALTNVNISFGDLNGDGKKDLVLGHFNGTVHYFENTSTGNTFSFVRKDTNYFKIDAGTEIAPQLVDLNKDEKLDLVIGKRNGTLAYFQNIGKTTSAQFDAKPTIDTLGKISVKSRDDVIANATPCIFDMDNDGIFEALIGSYSKGVTLFTGVTANPNQIATRYANIFKENTSMQADSISQGIYSSVSIANIDNDTTPEVLIGNERGGFRFYKSTILGKISPSTNSEVNIDNIKALIYPNPAKDYLIIETNLLNENFEVSIIDILGNAIVKNDNKKGISEVKLDLSAIKAGIYFAKINTESGKQLVKRIVVE